MTVLYEMVNLYLLACLVKLAFSRLVRITCAHPRGSEMYVFSTDDLKVIQVRCSSSSLYRLVAKCGFVVAVLPMSATVLQLVLRY